MMDYLPYIHLFKWTKSLTKFQDFDMSLLHRFVDSEGSKCLFQDGYKLFLSSYVKDVFTAEYDDKIVLVKAKCYPTIKKNELRELLCVMNTDENGKITCIKDIYCSCKAGLGKCIHLAGLCYLLSHSANLGLLEVPEEKTCTNLEQQWHKPRGEKIAPLPVMEVIVTGTDFDRKKKPLTCSLKRKHCVLPSSDEMEKFAEGIAKANPKSCLTYLLSKQYQPEVDKLPFGIVYSGSVMSHQLGNYREDFAEVKEPTSESLNVAVRCDSDY